MRGSAKPPRKVNEGTPPTISSPMVQEAGASHTHCGRLPTRGEKIPPKINIPLALKRTPYRAFESQSTLRTYERAVQISIKSWRKHELAVRSALNQTLAPIQIVRQGHLYPSLPQVSLCIQKRHSVL